MTSTPTAARSSAQPRPGAAQQRERMQAAASLPSLQLSPATVAHLAMLASGAYAPLTTFHGLHETESVLRTARLLDGTPWPLPILLPIDADLPISAGMRIALRDSQNHLLGLLDVEERFLIPSPAAHDAEASMADPVFTGATLPAYASAETPHAITGKLSLVHIPEDPQFAHLWQDPAAVRRQLAGRPAVAVGSWNPQDRASTDQLRALAGERDAVLLLNLAASADRVDLFDHYQHFRLCDRCFTSVFHAHPGTALLNLVHLSAVSATPRELLLQAIVQRNFGATCLLTEDLDPANPSTPALQAFATEIGVALEVAPRHHGSSVPVESQAALTVPGEWGLCLWLTGLPCSGKSVIAEQLLILLMEAGLRVTWLDGDTVRTHLSKGLSFSKEDRDTNVQRIGFVASEIVRHRGVVLCAAISPYRAVRASVRAMMPPGSFVEIFIDTPVEECERRDVKGFYAKARSGQLPHFTGVDDPYEAPQHPEAVVKTETTTPRGAALALLELLVRDAYLLPRAAK